MMHARPMLSRAGRARRPDVAIAACAALALCAPAHAQVELDLVWLAGSHFGNVPDLSFAPDGTSLLTAGIHDATVKLWSLPGGELQETLRSWPQATENPSAVAWSPSGTDVAIGTLQGKVILVDLAQGSFTTIEEEHPVRALAWALGGDLLLVGRDHPSVLLVSDGSPSGELTGATDPIIDLAVSPDGLHVAAGSTGAKAYYWDLSPASPALVLDGHSGSSHVAISPDGQTLATSDGTHLRLWRTSNGSLLSTHDESASGIAGLEFTGPQTVVYSGRSHRLRSRNIATGVLDFDLPLGLEITGHPALAHFPAADLLALGGSRGRVQVRDAGTGALVVEPVGKAMFAIARLGVSLDGTLLVVGGLSRIAQVRSSQSGGLITTVRAPSPVTSWPPPQEPLPRNSIFESVFTADSQHIHGACNDGFVRKWNAATGAAAGSILVSEEYPLLALALFAGDTLALCGTGEPVAKVVRLSDGNVVHTLSGHERFIRSVAVSPDESLLATGDNSGQIKLWDAQSGQLALDLSGHAGGIAQLAFSPDGSKLASGGADGLVRLWSPDDGRLLHELEHPSPDPATLAQVTALAFAPSGAALATVSSADVRFWNADTGDELDWAVPESHQVQAVAWVGGRVIFGRRDGSLFSVSTP